MITAAGFLFDMDGVLIDSIPAVDRVWRRWAGERGLDPDEVARRAHGRPSLATVRDYLPQLGAAEQERENLRIERQEMDDVEGIVALPGALELLRALPAERWAIVTSCTRPLAEARARAGGLPHARQFITASDITRGKPDAEPYLLGAARLGFAASDCMVVEDVVAGVLSGKAAGARVIGVGGGDLSAAGADWIVAHCGQIGVRVTAAGLAIQIACDSVV